jgi:hypothetical protein
VDGEKHPDLESRLPYEEVDITVEEQTDQEAERGLVEPTASMSCRYKLRMQLPCQPASASGQNVHKGALAVPSP